MLRFKQFISESDSTVFHTSPKPISQVGSGAMFFSLSHEHAKGWHANSMDNHGSAHTYSAQVTGNIAHHSDPKVKKVLSDAGVDQDDYHADLASNPSAKEVADHPGTKALSKAGYHGLVYPDYHPADFDKDADAMVVFNPSEHVKGMKKQLWEKYDTTKNLFLGQARLSSPKPKKSLGQTRLSSPKPKKPLDNAIKT